MMTATVRRGVAVAAQLRSEGHVHHPWLTGLSRRPERGLTISSATEQQEGWGRAAVHTQVCVCTRVHMCTCVYVTILARVRDWVHACAYV